MRKSLVVSISFLVLLLCSGLSMVPTVAAATVDGSGPYVDKLVYTVITQDDQQVLALQDNEIDIIGDSVDPMFIDTLTEAADIDVAQQLRNGYGYVTINTDKNPLNYTAFRRALAFALDKTAISDDVWGGLAEPLDSAIPAINPYTIEGQLPYTYYESNVALGTALLEAAGFFIDGMTGFRNDPQDNPFDVVVEVAQSSNIAIESGQKVVDALTALNIDATLRPTDFYEYLNRLYFHGDYDIIFIGRTLTDFDVDWLANEYWSEHADEPYYNYPNFMNVSFDSWRDQLLYSTNYDDVYEAAIEMQKILVYQCPIIVLYENLLLSAYRTDRFEGQVNDVSYGMPGWWTNQKVNLKDSEGGPFGGTFRVSNSLDIDSFNFMVSNSEYAANVNNELWDSLFRYDSQGNIVNWLADSLLIETHADNTDVPDGNTRFTMNIVQNASWTDYMPITAQDVAFTFNYYRDAPGNPYGVSYADDIYAIYAPTDYIFVMEFTTESYWHLSSFADKPILPKHVFKDIGVDGWNLWNPDPPTETMVTSGPFYVSDYVAGEFVELTKNENYFVLPTGSTGGGSPEPLPPSMGAPTPLNTEELFIEQYAERLAADIPSNEKMDPILKDYMAFGTLDDNVVTNSDNDVKIVLFLTPEADQTTIEQIVEINWRTDLKVMHVISASIDDAADLKILEAIDGVSYIQADTYLTQTEIEASAPEMFEIGDVIGRTGTYAADYDGSGVVVGVVDDGVDFSLPDMKDAQYVDSDGNPGDFDPSGWGITEMYVANRSFVADVPTWLSEGKLLTYESGGKYYLNVTDWDPKLNNNGGSRNLMGLRAPYGDGYPEGSNVGFVGYYEWAYNINNASEFVYNEMWKDWEIPVPGTEDYTFGWGFQQRQNEYAKVFIPSMIYDGELVIDWNATEAWNYMWNYAIWYETIDLNVQADRDWITGMMDWNFTDDFDNGDVFGVGTGNNPVLSVDFNDDGVDDLGVGSLTWVNDGFGFLSGGIDTFFCGIEDNNMAWAAMFNTEGTHGTWTATAVGSRGVYNHEVWEDDLDDPDPPQKLPGIANGSKIIAVKGTTSGDDLGAHFWAAGFHLNSTGYFEYTVEGQKHKADIISNSWGYVNGAYLTMTYLTMSWDLMSVPGIIDPAYPGTLFFVSSGNSGPEYMTNGAPDSAFSVISVGGTTVTHAYDELYEDGQLQLNQEAWFASNGPSFVGIVKPDIVAPSIFGRSPNAFHNVWLDLDDSSRWWSGTSLACPIAAGATALILEAVRTNLGDANWYNPQILKDIVLSTAKDIGVDPFIQGHGLIDVASAIDWIENSGGYAIQSESFANYAPIMADAWDYWMPGWAPFGVWVDDYGGAHDYPIGLESSSIFFGNVYPSGTYDVDLTMIDLNDLATTAVSSDFGSFVPWYYRMGSQFNYTVNTRAHNDTNLYNIYRGDAINLTSLLSSGEMTSFTDAPYVTINAGFSVDNIGIGMRVWDYDDRNSDGVTNFWYNYTYPGDYIQWVSRDTSNCNNLIARLSSDRNGDVGDLFDNTPVVQFEDPVADETSGTEILLTFTIWERVLDSTISLSDNAANTTVTLDVPADAEYGIHQGSIFVNTTGYSHEIPYSYMVVFEADGAEDEVMTLVDSWGSELTPYESGAWSASYDIGAETRMDGGGHRTFAIDIPAGRSILVMKAEWQNTGTVVDMYLRATTYHLETQTNDGYGPPFDPTPTEDTKNTIVYDPGGDIAGSYYLEVSVHIIDGSTAYENITITLQTYSSLADAAFDPTWTSNTSPTPAAFAADDVLVGDHVVIENTWTLSSPSNLPEYNITNTRLSLLSGLYYENTGTLTDPQGYDGWPVPLNMVDAYHWETVDGINAGDTVYIELQSADSDTSFDVYEWDDANEDGQVQWDTELVGNAFISIDAGSSGVTESGSFVAPNDMSIAIRIFAWAWAWSPGDEYTCIVDTRISIDVDSPTETANYDTYELGHNSTLTIQLTAWTSTDVVFVYDLGDVTFENFFSPVVTVVSPNGGETWTGANAIIWTSTSLNSVDFDPDHQVYISNDDGESYMLIGAGLTSTTLDWNCADWQLKSNYSVLVRTLDRGMFGFDESDSTFTAGELASTDLAPVVRGDDDLSYTLGATGNEIDWYVADPYPYHLELWVDDVKVTEPAWNTPTVTITRNCDGHSVGIYNYTLVAFDANGNSASYTIWVEVSDHIAPTIDHPDDFSYHLGITGNEIIWTPSDVYPSHYLVTLDGAHYENGTWDGSAITVNVDGLPIGTYEFNITVYDLVLLTASDEVNVTVLSDTEDPVIDEPADIVYYSGETSYDIDWTPTDSTPSHYTITRDGTLVDSGTWDGSPISFNVDGLGVGTYFFNLTVHDDFSNTAFDIVEVTVIPDEFPTIDSPDDILYYLGETGNTIDWTTTDEDPSTYELYVDGALVDSGAWDGSSFSIDINGLSAGTYYYNLTLYDDRSQSIFDVVEVIVIPDEFPTIDSPDDILYYLGETGNTIDWTTTDEDPSNYELYVDGALIDSGTWDGSSFSIDIDGLSTGTYYYNLTLYDDRSNSVFDEVMITVIPDDFPTIDSPDDIVYYLGETGNTIDWTPNDDDPSDYELYLGSIMIDSGPWDGSPFSFSIDGMGLGTYTYNLTVYDDQSNWIFDVVEVTVIPDNPPTIDNPDDVEYYVGDTGYVIDWTTGDEDPSDYELYVDDVLIESDTWDGSSFSIDVDGLSAGTYYYNLTLYDDRSNSVFDEVVVTVLPDDPPAIDNPSDILYYLGETGNDIDWVCSDIDPSHYMITRNGVLVASGPWDGSPISISADGLAVGDYTFNLTLYDTRSHTVFDLVEVTVIPDDLPSIDSPDDIVYYLGETGNTIDWTPSDDDPSNYELYLGSILIDSGPWDGGPFSFSIDGMGLGTYTYNLTVYDDESNWIFDVVEVTVIPDNPPTIDNPDDVEYYVGDTGSVIDWTTSDEDPSDYELYVDDVLVDSGAWDGSSFSIDIDGLSAGTYHYNLTLYDDRSNSVFDEVVVTVLADDPPAIDNPSDILYYLGETGNDIDWVCSDIDPSHYMITRNGVLVSSGSWDGSPISVNADGLAVGDYTFNLTLYDTRSHTVFDVVEVTVIPDNPPTIDNPDDVAYYLGETGNLINWTTGDDDPSDYELYVDDVLNDSGPWDGSSFSIDVDGLLEGTYYYNLTLYDDRSNSVFDVVIVTVTVEDTDAPIIDSPVDILYYLGDTGFSIEWNPTDTNPASYAIYRNGTEVISGVWNSTSETISINVDGLTAGVYNYTLNVLDIVDASESDSVIVVVIDDGTSPSVDSPDDVTYEVDETGNSISWVASDEYPATYQIFRNGTQIESGEWSSSESLTIDVDGLSEGIYNFTIVLYDDAGNSVSDEVVVTVTSQTTDPTSTLPTSGTITTTLPGGDVMIVITLVIAAGSAGVIVVVIIIFLRGRKGV